MQNKVVNYMFDNDEFSKMLGMEIVEIKIGIVNLRMALKKHMLNGFSIAHGGITYSLADSALAFSANSHGIQSVSIETSISHVKKVVEGDILTTEVIEKNLTSKTGLYEVIVRNQNNEPVAFFKGTVFRTGKPWEV